MILAGWLISLLEMMVSGSPSCAPGIAARETPPTVYYTQTTPEPRQCQHAHRALSETRCLLHYVQGITSHMHHTHMKVRSDNTTLLVFLNSFSSTPHRLLFYLSGSNAADPRTFVPCISSFLETTTKSTTISWVTWLLWVFCQFLIACGHICSSFY